MNASKSLIAGSLASLIAMSLSMASSNAFAAAGDTEKCAGVVKAGKNDCFSARHSCGGTSVKDNEPDAWIYVPEGACGKITGASTGTEKK